MNNEVALLTEGIGLFLGSWVVQARDRLTLVAPFIKRKALERLISNVGPSVRLTVMTRWSVDEICAGVSDLGVFDLVRERPGSRLLLHPRLHAKVMLADDTAAVIGSANISDTALGFVDQPNAEVMAALKPIPNKLFLFLLQLERESVPATEELRQQFEEAVKTAPPPSSYPTVQIPSLHTVPGPFPRFRIPEQLFRGYVSVVEFGDRETRSAILSDLQVLSLPDGMNEPEFRDRVGTALLTVDIVAAFDAFVREPQFFGEMADWVKTRQRCAGLDAEQRKHYLQTMIRWLLHFRPGVYSLTEPGYSERFGHAERR